MHLAKKTPHSDAIGHPESASEASGLNPPVGLLEPEAFRRAIRDELAWSMRRNQRFAVIVFELQDTPNTPRSSNRPKLEALRDTDLLSWLEPGQLGVLRRDVPRTEAEAMAAQLSRELAPAAPPPCTVYLFPPPDSVSDGA